MAGPLNGVRVLAVERILAGPYSSMILGDLGAEVIKIEPPGGEQVRLMRLPPFYKGEPAYFLAFNRNKKSIVLDLMTSTGLEAFYGLTKVSDVVVDNNRPGVMEKLKIDYDTLKKINPGIICCSITGYGATGPYAQQPSVDIITQGISGLLLQTGEPGGPPIKPAPALSDLLGGLFGAIGVMAALNHRHETGEGQRVEVSLLDSAMASLAMHYAIYFLTGEVPPPIGTGHLQSVPHGAYRTQDGWISIGMSWPRIARTLGIEWVLDDPRFTDIADRLKNRAELNRIISERLAQGTSETWLELLHADDIAAGPVHNLDTAPEDPQVLHNKIILALEHSLGGEIKLVGNPVRMPAVHPEEYVAPPTLGQHTHEVLSGLLGYPEEKIRQLETEQEKHFQELQKHYLKER